jgi:hypothetical protein
LHLIEEDHVNFAAVIGGYLDEHLAGDNGS